MDICAARIGFGCCTVSYAAAQLVFFAYTASLIPAWIPGASFWTALTTLAFALVIAGAAWTLATTTSRSAAATALRPAR